MKYDRCTLQCLNNLTVIADVAGHKLGTDWELGLVPAGSSITMGLGRYVTSSCVP